MCLRDKLWDLSGLLLCGQCILLPVPRLKIIPFVTSSLVKQMLKNAAMLCEIALSISYKGTSILLGKSSLNIGGFYPDENQWRHSLSSIKLLLIPHQWNIYFPFSMRKKTQLRSTKSSMCTLHRPGSIQSLGFNVFILKAWETLISPHYTSWADILRTIQVAFKIKKRNPNFPHKA